MQRRHINLIGVHYQFFAASSNIRGLSAPLIFPARRIAVAATIQCYDIFSFRADEHRAILFTSFSWVHARGLSPYCGDPLHLLRGSGLRHNVPENGEPTAYCDCPRNDNTSLFFDCTCYSELLLPIVAISLILGGIFALGFRIKSSKIIS